MSTCRVFSCVVGRGCLLWPVRSLGKTLLAFALLHYVLQGQICLLLQVSLDFLLLHSSPLEGKARLFWVLVLECLVGLHRTIQLQLLQHSFSITGSTSASEHSRLYTCLDCTEMWLEEGSAPSGWHPGLRQILLDSAKVHLRTDCRPGVSGSLLVSCLYACVHGHSVMSDSFNPNDP